MRTGDVEVGTYGPCDEGSAIDCGRRKRNSRARSVRAGFGLPGADTTYATSEGTADLNTDSRALEFADVETNASEAAGAWDEEIKIGRFDRIVISPARDVTRHAVTLIVGAPLLALAFCVVWLGGSDSHFTVEQRCAPRKPSNLQQIDRIVQYRSNRQFHRRTRLLHQSVVYTALQNAAFNT